MKHLMFLLLLVPYVSFSSYKSVNEDPIKVEKVKSISVGNIETPAVNGCAGTASFTAAYDPLNCCWSFQNTTTNDCMQWNCTWDFGDSSTLVTTPQGVGTACHPYMYPGTYTVTLIFDSSPCHGGSGGICYGTQTVTIPPLSVTSTLSSYIVGSSTYNISCEGENDGWITLNAAVGYTYQWQTTPIQYGNSISNLTAGTYVCNVGHNGCVDVFTVTLTEPLMQTNEVIQHPLCYNDANGSIDLTTTGGCTPLSYQWSHGPTSADVNNLTAGPYSVDITDVNGVVRAFQFQLTEPTQLISSVTATTNYNGYNISCFDSSDGAINLFVNGSVPPYLYSWNTGEITEDLLDVPFGNYSVNIIDAHGCTSQQFIFLTEPTPLISSIQSTTNFNGYDISCFGDSVGIIDVTVSGSVPTYSYQWSGTSTSTTEDLLNIPAGPYTVDITDQNGCTSQRSILLTEPTPLTSSIQSFNNYNGYDIPCHSDSIGSIDLTVNGSVFPYTYSWNTTPIQVTQDIYNLKQGYYSVNVVDLNGCTTFQDIILTDPPPYTSNYITSNYNGFNISCFDLSDGSIDLTVSGSVPTYSYLWSSGETTADITNLSYGVYFVTITDINGCVHNVSMNLTQPSQLISYTNPLPVSCFDSLDGGITLSVSGGVPTYLYLWGNILPTPPFSSTNQSISNIHAGTYHVVVSDANGCLTYDTATVVEPSPIISSIQSVYDYNGYDISCYGYSDGAIDLTVSGSAPPYIYTWVDPNGVSTTNSIDSLVNVYAGSYTVTIEDANGCVAVENITLVEPTDFAFSVFTSNYNGVHVSCYDSSDAFINHNLSGSVLPYRFSWVSSTPIFPSNVEDLDSIPSGFYQLNVLDTNNCPYYFDTLLIQPTPLIPSAIPTTNYNGFNISCYDSTDGGISLVVNGGIFPYNYSWSNGSSQTTLTNLSADTFSVIINDLNGCLAYDTVILVEPTPLISSIQSVYDYNSFDISCTGYSDGAIDLTVSGSVPQYIYSWSNGNTAQDLAGIGAGAYTVTITDDNGCVAVENITLVEPTDFAFSVFTSNYNGFHVSCYDSLDAFINHNLSGSVLPYRFSWVSSTPIFPSNVEDLDSISAGFYQLNVLDTNNCPYYFDTLLIQPTPLIPSAIPTTNYNGFNISCYDSTDGGISLVVNGGIFPYNYSWSNGSSQTTLTNLNSDTYSVIITDLNGCLAYETVILIEPTPLISSIQSVYDYNGYDISCTGYSDGAINLIVSGSVLPYTYSWNNAAFSQDLSILTTGYYEVDVLDDNGCKSNASITLFEPSIFTSNLQISNYFGYNISCYGFQDGSIDITLNGSVPPYNYSWQGPNSYTSTSEDIDNIPAGFYFVDVLDANNCDHYRDTILIQPDTLIITLSTVTDTCNWSVGSAEAIVRGGIPPYIYLWEPSFSNVSTATQLSGSNELTVSDQANCLTSISFSVNDLLPPIADFTVNPTLYRFVKQLENPIQFFDSSFDSWSQIIFWDWYFDDGDSAFVNNPLHSYNDVGIFEVVLVVENKFGCLDTVSKVIEIKDFLVYIPSAFTPQNDGINDKFGPKGIGIDEFEMKIFDRWGEKVFISNDIEIGWDGTYQIRDVKRIAQIGVYVYSITILDVFGEIHNYVGKVTLIR